MRDDLADSKLEDALFGERIVGPQHALRLRQAAVAWRDARRARPWLRLSDWLEEQGLRASPYAFLRPDDDDRRTP